jgi:hypothetical protein
MMVLDCGRFWWKEEERGDMSCEGRYGEKEEKRKKKKDGDRRSRRRPGYR